MTENTKITVETTVNANVEIVWVLWTSPLHIVKWNHASDDWHTTTAENDLKVGGSFSYRMEAKDGSSGFDFAGTYDVVEQHKQISYSLGDNRKVDIIFQEHGDGTKVIETFDAESSNTLELQRFGWQSILDNFKKYVESITTLENLHFEITIDAPVSTVYNKMIEPESYNSWTAEFNPTSHYKGSWEKGSKILFIGSDDDGNEGGMVSLIAENIPNKFVSIKHIGLLHGDKEITSGPEIIGWAGALENYSFTEVGNSTLLAVDLEANAEYQSYFDTTWPKALNVLKSICENN
jgi:uncharacterized protein YndB with AHSA1/START domain